MQFPCGYFGFELLGNWETNKRPFYYNHDSTTYQNSTKSWKAIIKTWGCGGTFDTQTTAVNILEIHNIITILNGDILHI